MNENEVIEESAEVVDEAEEITEEDTSSTAGGPPSPILGKAKRARAHRGRAIFSQKVRRYGSFCFQNEKLEMRKEERRNDA